MDRKRTRPRTGYKKNMNKNMNMNKNKNMNKKEQQHAKRNHCSCGCKINQNAHHHPPPPPLPRELMANSRLPPICHARFSEALSHVSAAAWQRRRLRQRPVSLQQQHQPDLDAQRLRCARLRRSSCHSSRRGRIRRPRRRCVADATAADIGHERRKRRCRQCCATDRS